MVSRVIPVEPFDLVVFGGTGDLARRKILPGLYRRFWSGQIPEDSRIIGAARSTMGEDDYRSLVREAIGEFVSADKCDARTIAAFLDRITYVAIDAKGKGGWTAARRADARGRDARLLLLGRAGRCSATWPSGCTATASPMPAAGSWSRSPSAAISPRPAR